MNEMISTVGSNALVLDSPEDTLTREASLIEQQASSVVVTNDAEYAVAGDLTKAVKQMQKKVKDYWEPMRVNAKAAYDEVLAHKKEKLYLMFSARPSSASSNRSLATPGRPSLL